MSWKSIVRRQCTSILARVRTTFSAAAAVAAAGASPDRAGEEGPERRFRRALYGELVDLDARLAARVVAALAEQVLGTQVLDVLEQVLIVCVHNVTVCVHTHTRENGAQSRTSEVAECRQ